MSQAIKIPKRVSTALLNSLGAGVVPRTGLEHIVVGRKHEITALLKDLENVASGGAAFRIIAGRYGSGKSFLLQLMRTYSMERNFVVADADLSPERRLSGSNGQGLATYRELMGNLATRTRPDGGALKAILERWLSNIQSSVMKASGKRPGDPGFNELVEEQIFETVQSLEGLVHGFDFSTVVSAYWRGFQEGNDNLKDSAMRWLRGEYSTKTEARQDLNVRVIIDDQSWYDYLKLMAQFITSIGYKGLIVIIDEAVNLYKITHTVSRHANYEKLLAILNDTLQGKAQHLQVFVGCTPKLLEDTRRGLYSYDALKTRLEPSRYIKEGLLDVSGPVIKLQTLSSEEVFLLLQRLRDVHAFYHGYESTITDQELITFMNEVLNRLGSEAFLTPRDVIRDVVSILNLLLQNPNESFLSLVQGEAFEPSKTDVASEAAKEETLPDPASAEFASFDL